MGKELYTCGVLSLGLIYLSYEFGSYDNITFFSRFVISIHNSIRKDVFSHTLPNSSSSHFLLCRLVATFRFTFEDLVSLC